MDRLIFIVALIANTLQITALLYMGYSNVAQDNLPQVFLMILLVFAPVLSMIVIFQGPDMEERRLSKKLRKAQMRKDLKALGEKE